MCLKGKQEETVGDVIISCRFCELTDDLIAEIFCRLPHDCLIRCKLLCKLCFRVITDICVPKVSASTSIVGFLYRTYYLRGSNGGGGGVGGGGGGGDGLIFVQFLPYKIPAYPDPATIDRPYSELLPFRYGMRDLCDCCNGLLLFVDRSIPQFYVCNPTTKQCIKIPGHVIRFQRAALAFDPLRSQHYKIVNLRDFPDEMLEIDVFSSETGKWVSSSIPLKTLEGNISLLFRTVCHDDALYRLCHMNPWPPKKYLMRIDLHEYKAQFFERPDRDLVIARGSIGVSRGSLCYSNIDDSTCFIWLFEYGHDKAGRWIFKHKISLVDLIDSPFTQCGCEMTNATRFNPQACDPNSEDLFFVNHKIMVRYRPGDKKVEVLFRMGRQNFICVAECGVLTYAPCLVMLKDF